PRAGRLPDAAGRKAHVEDSWLTNHSSDGCDATSPEGTDVAPSQSGVEGRIGRRCGRRLGVGMESKSPQAAEKDPGGEQPTAGEAPQCHMNPNEWRESGTGGAGK